MIMIRKETISSKDFRDLEQQVNRRLREIGQGFAIRHLVRNPDGTYRFELAVAIDPRQRADLRRVLREVLKGLPMDRHVQAKFYLPESVVRRVKEVARERGISQSALVKECLTGKL